MTQEATTQQTTGPEPAGLTVRVESFVGPLDLLLHLCRTNEMDLSRLSLRTITDQYLSHLEAVRFQDLEMAGSFMVMAATLIYLKSKLLLPADPNDQEEALDEEGELLKRELEERLREYARVKALGVWLSEREAEQTLVYGRTTAELPPPEDIPLEDLSVHLLQRAMQRLIEDQKRRVPRQVEPNPLSVLERMSEILDLLRNVNRDFGTATILITHNLGVVAGMCERVMVMYAGRVVESGPTVDVFAHPKHPYTWSLLRSIPRLDAERHEPLKPIDGLPPDLIDLPTGCAFHPRCQFKVERCSRDSPVLNRVGETQLAACWVTQSGVELKGA